MSKESEKAKKLYHIFRGLSIAVTMGPLLVYFILSFARATVVNKLVVGSTLALVLVLTLINLIGKYKLRSPLFLLLIGIYVGLGNILTPLYITTIGVVLDEFIFSPCAAKYKDLYTINHTMDKRLEG